MAHRPCRRLPANLYGYPLCGEIMTNINLAPYSVHRFFDGAEVTWIVEEGCYRGLCLDTRVYETRQDAEAERNRLNTAYGLDKIGV